MSSPLDSIPARLRTQVVGKLEERQKADLNLPVSSVEDTIARIACSFTGHFFLEIMDLNVDAESLHEHFELCSGERFVPISKSGIAMVIATTRPWDERHLRNIRSKTKCQIEPIGAPSIAIDRIFADFRTQPKVSPPVSIEPESEFQIVTRWPIHLRPAKLARTIIESAFRQDSSDIHLEPWEDRLVVRFRIHGTMETMPPLPFRIGDEVIQAFKSMANLPVGEVQKCSGGRIDISFSKNEQIGLRLEKQPVIRGEAIVCRLLDDRFILSQKGALPFDPKGNRLIGNVLSKSSGMFIVTGPTGSGKTTTNYLCIASMDRDGKKIISVEDPVEYVMPGVQQVSVADTDSGISRSFSDVLRSSLRCDPDILIVGEIRDSTTADISARAVQTGHLVMATLHTEDSIGVIPRLMGLGVHPSLISQILSVVVSQRLCYRLCDNCKSPVTPSDSILRHYDFYGMEHPEVVYERMGCKECKGSGTVGRFPIFEILHLNRDLRSLIREPFNRIEFREKWLAGGGASLTADGLERVSEGLTTYAQVAAYDEDFIAFS